LAEAVSEGAVTPELARAMLTFGTVYRFIALHAERSGELRAAWLLSNFQGRLAVRAGQVRCDDRARQFEIRVEAAVLRAEARSQRYDLRVARGGSGRGEAAKVLAILERLAEESPVEESLERRLAALRSWPWHERAGGASLGN
jgi:hypothetical protein